MTREEAVEVLKERYLTCVGIGLDNHANRVNEAIDMAIEALSADAVQVVRCKDCKHYKKINPKVKSGMCYKDIVASAWNDDGFCSRGKRKGGDDE